MPPFILTLLAQGLGLLGNAILAKGKDVIEEKLGVNIQEMTQSPEGLLKLKQLEVDHEEFLIKSAIEAAKVSLSSDTLSVDNTKNARDSNARIQESTDASFLAKNSAYILDFLIVGGTILLAYLLFFAGIPPANKEIAFAAFGSLMTLCGTIINFHRGSSQGSKTANAQLTAISNQLAGESK